MMVSLAEGTLVVQNMNKEGSAQDDVEMNEIDNTTNTPPVITPQVVSFKDKLVGSEEQKDEFDKNWQILVNIEETNVEINTEGKIPPIKFSDRVRKALESSIKNIVVARFLSEGFGYKRLKYGIDMIWKPKGGVSYCGLREQVFLVQFD